MFRIIFYQTLFPECTWLCLNCFLVSVLKVFNGFHRFNVSLCFLSALLREVPVPPHPSAPVPERPRVSALEQTVRRRGPLWRQQRRDELPWVTQPPHQGFVYLVELHPANAWNCKDHLTYFLISKKILLRCLWINIPYSSVYWGFYELISPIQVFIEVFTE